MQILRFIAISFVSGITAIIPGVSGGTIFAIFGISEPLAEGINGLVETVFTQFKSIKKLTTGILKYGQLPIIIGLGSLFSSLFYAKVLVSYGASIETLLRFLFIGLVLFSLPTLWSETKTAADTDEKSYRLKYVYVIIGFLVAIVLFNSDDAVISSVNQNYFSPMYLSQFFIVSLVAGITTILPGISGTNILILGGVFEDYIIFSSHIGAYPLQYTIYLIATIIGSVIAAKFFTILFKKFRRGFFSIMTGLTASTIVFIWANPFTSVFNVVQALIGIGCAYLLIKTLNEQENKVKNQ